MLREHGLPRAVGPNRARGDRHRRCGDAAAGSGIDSAELTTSRSPRWSAACPLGSVFGFLRAHDSHPPLDYLLQLPLARAGREPVPVPAPAALCSIGALALFAWWMRDRGRVGSSRPSPWRSARFNSSTRAKRACTDRWSSSASRRGRRRRVAPLTAPPPCGHRRRAHVRRIDDARLDDPRWWSGCSRWPDGAATPTRGGGAAGIASARPGWAVLWGPSFLVAVAWRAFVVDPAHDTVRVPRHDQRRS